MSKSDTENTIYLAIRRTVIDGSRPGQTQADRQRIISEGTEVVLQAIQSGPFGDHVRRQVDNSRRVRDVGEFIERIRGQINQFLTRMINDGRDRITIIRQTINMINRVVQSI